MLKNLILSLIGKKVGNEVGVSKAKLTAVIYVLVVGIKTIPAAFGHPIEIPDYVFRVLEAAGLWAVRDALNAPTAPTQA